MPRINRVGKKFQIYSDEGIGSHFQNLAKNIENLANRNSNRDVRVHCQNQIIVTANKFILACSSKFLNSIFSSNYDCAFDRITTFDLICPSFNPEAMKKVIEISTGNECYIEANNYSLYREIKSIIKTLEIKIELPSMPQEIKEKVVVPDSYSDDEEYTVDYSMTSGSDESKCSLKVDPNFCNPSATNEEIKPVFVQKHIVCDYCDQTFTSSTFLDKHIQSHFQARHIDGSNIVNYHLTKTTPETDNLNVPPTSVPYQCDLCSKSFVLKISMDQHRKKHFMNSSVSHEQQEPENKLDTTFVVHSKNNNITHNTLVPALGDLALPYICGSCEKGFLLKIAMDSHKRKNTCGLKNNKVVELPSVEKLVHDKSNQLTFINEPGFDANESVQKTPTQDNVVRIRKLKRVLVFDDFDTDQQSEKKEVKLNDKYKVYRCYMCSHECRRYQNLLSHMAASHYKDDMKKLFVNKKPWKCNLCDKILTSKTALLLHLVQRHKAIDKSIPTKKALTVYLDHAPEVLQNATKVLKTEKISTASKANQNIKVRNKSKVTDNEDPVITVAESNNHQSTTKSLENSTATSEIQVLQILTKSVDIKVIENATAGVNVNANLPQAVPEVTSASRIYKCPMCDERSSKSVILLKHMAMEHFKDKIMSKYGKESQWQCGECKDTFINEDSLVNHLMNTHKALKNIMSLQAFITQKKAKEAQSLHSTDVASREKLPPMKTKEQSFPCPKCNTTFSAYQHLQTHAAMIHFDFKLRSMCGDKKWECRLCKTVFSTKRDLYYHLVSHHEALNGLLPDQKSFADSKSTSSIYVSKDENFSIAVKKKQKIEKSSETYIPKYLIDSGVNLEPVVILDKISKKKIESLKANMNASGKEQSSPEFQCHICGQISATHEKVLSHYGNIHYRQKLMNFYGNKDHACVFCVEYLPSNEENLIAHLVTTHKALDIYLPEKTSLEIVAKAEPKEQKSKQQELKSSRHLGFFCPKCTEVFIWKPALHNHMQTCSGKKEKDEQVGQSASKFNSKKNDASFSSRNFKLNVTR